MFTALLHAASVARRHRGETQQRPLLHRLRRYVWRPPACETLSRFPRAQHTNDVFSVNPPAPRPRPHHHQLSGEELIYLDPHTTQPAVEPCEDGRVPDETYHCQHPPCRMHICELDPSIAAVLTRKKGRGGGLFAEIRALNIFHKNSY